MISKQITILCTCLGLLTGNLFAASSSAPAPSVGIVNFSQCMSDSKLGQQEQASFEALKEQMNTLIQDTESQMSEMTAQFNDEDYMDGLSPEAEEEMKNRYQALNQEMSRYQNQFYQVMNQAQMKIVQSLGAGVQEASAKIAENKKLTMILNKEACFYHGPVLDVTNHVVAEMDLAFEKQSKQMSANPQAQAPLPN